MKRVFFFGAGASRAAGMPLTNELTAGIAHSLVQDPTPSRHRLVDYLKRVHHLTQTELQKASEYWQARYIEEQREVASDLIENLPSIIYVLSLLDVFIADQSVIYDRKITSHRSKQVDRRELERVRERTVQCLALAFEEFETKLYQVPEWLGKFVGSLSVSDDFLVTTNWDILLDRAIVESRVQPKGSLRQPDPIDYGTDVQIVDIAGENSPSTNGQQNRRSLYKLHGSFGWLYCQRCTNLYSNPRWPIASLGFGSSRPTDDQADKCDCGTKLFSVLVTPTFAKSYENRHLGNVWAAALRSLNESDQWHFIGYSFPADDLNIRALLLRALKIRSCPPHIIVASQVATENDMRKLELRVHEILGKEGVEFRYNGAEEYLKDLSSK